MNEKQFMRWMCFAGCGYMSLGAAAFLIYTATTTTSYVGFFMLSPLILFSAAWFGWCALQAWRDKL